MSKHVFFDDASAYSDYRSEFIAEQRLYGLFLSLKIASEWKNSQELVEPARAVEFNEGRYESDELRPALADAHADHKIVVAVDAEQIIDVPEATITEIYDEAASKFKVIVKGLDGHEDCRARLFAFESEVLTNLLETISLTPQESKKLTPLGKLERLIRSGVIGETWKLSHLWASIDDADSIVNQYGNCVIESDVPEDSGKLPEGSWLVLVIERK